MKRNSKTDRKIVSDNKRAIENIVRDFTTATKHRIGFSVDRVYQYTNYKLTVIVNTVLI